MRLRLCSPNVLNRVWKLDHRNTEFGRVHTRVFTLPDTPLKFSTRPKTATKNRGFVVVELVAVVFSRVVV